VDRRRPAGQQPARILGILGAFDLIERGLDGRVRRGVLGKVAVAVTGDGHRGPDGVQGVADHPLVVAGAEQNADGETIIGTSKQVVDSVDIEVQLAGVLRLETTGLELDDDVAAQAEVAKEQVDEELIPLTSRRYWRPTKAKPAPSSRRNVEDGRRARLDQCIPRSGASTPWY
jgi:hypothetical protein